METATVLSGLQELGFVVVVDANGDLSLTGPLSQLDERRRNLIREHKPALVALLTGRCPNCGSTETSEGLRYRWCNTCETKLGDRERQLEADAMAFADSPEADEPLVDLMEWFDSLPAPTDEYFADRCRHDADPNRGSWDIQSGRLACRYCGRFYREAATEATADPAPVASRRHSPKHGEGVNFLPI